jgi:hypothetical protein
MRKQGTAKPVIEVTVKTAIKPIIGGWDGTSAALPTPEAVVAAYAPVKPRARKTASHKVSAKVQRMTVKKATKDAHDSVASYAAGMTRAIKAEAAAVKAKSVKAKSVEDVEPTVKVDKAVSLAAKVAAKKPAPIVLDPPVKSPLHKALKKAGFKFIQAQKMAGTVAYGYTHKDQRAALLTVDTEGGEAWQLRYPDGDTSSGSVTGKLATFTALLGVSVARHNAGKARVMKKLEVAVSKSPVDTSILGVGSEEDYVAPVKLLPEEVAGVSANVARAVEMLGSLTARRFDLDMLRGDKHYGHRMALLKRLFDREKVLVAETGINNLTEAFFSAVGAGDGCKAAKMECFAARCIDIDKRVRAAKADAAKQEKALNVLKARATVTARTVPGTILPYPAELKLSRTQQKLKEAAEREDAKKQLLAASPEQPAVPHPDAILEPVCEDLRLLEDISKDAEGRIVMLQMEKANSQGAICVYNNGMRVAAGVVAPETLKTLRVVAGVDPADFARQLLNPEIPSVPVTPVAARHLTAVLKCCKENTTMATTTEAPVRTKKFEAKTVTAKKAVKSAKKAAKTSTEPKGERKSSLFRLSNATVKEWGAFTGQKGVIVAAFKKLGAVGAKATGITRGALITALPDVPAANISFYLSKWQEPKIVEKLAAAK